MERFAYKDLQDRLMLVNSNLVGIKERTTCTPPPSGPGTPFHPAAKNDWGIVDRIRGCLGKYLTVYDSKAYKDLPGGLLKINYGIYASAVRDNGETNNGAVDVQLGRLKKQLVNIVLDYDIQASASWQSIPRLGPGATYAFGRHEDLSLTANRQNWEAWQNKSVDNWFSWNSTGNTYDPIGRTRWYKFVSMIGSYSYEGSSYKGLGRGLFEQHPNFEGSILDHTSIFYGPPNQLALREKSGMLFDVTPTYNYYVQTSVPYEEVIADGDIPEYLLSNVYYLQHELANTGSTLLAPWHLGALTLDQNIEYFEITNANNVTEANTREYYSLYTDGLQNLQFGPEAEMETVKETLEETNKNLAVLHSDLGALSKDSIHLSTVPFYNTIVIGSWQDQVTGYADNKSILNALYDDKETRGFIDILQYMAISNIGTSNVASGSFNYSSKRIGQSPGIKDGERMAQYLNGDASFDILFDLGDLCTWLGPEESPSNGPVVIQDINQDLSIFDSNPFKRIRDHRLKDMMLDPQCIPKAVTRMFDTAPEGDLASIAGVTRPMEDVYQGKPCHAETLLYIIEKRQKNPVVGEQGPLLQTIYISPRLHSGSPLYYYDSQVKYNQKYSYEIYKVVLIFGNEYAYRNQDIPNSPNKLEMTAKIRNWSSVKAVVVPHMQGSLDAPPIIDKPPIEPDMSFYSYKGVNNKLLILLNAGLGQNAEAPVEILDSDKEYFEEEYFSQKGENKAFKDIKEQGDKIIFRSDDPVDRYQLFRLDRVPTSYQDFIDNMMPEVDPDFGISGTVIDEIEPNRKYYYCARSIDVHENVSNPTHIIEIEMVDNNGQIFLKERVFNFEKQKENFVKSGRRFIYIEPSLQQLVFDPNGYASGLGYPNLTVDPESNILGAQGVEDQVWGKGFKVRLTSKKTGRKMDLNINFTNTGQVKPSE